MRVSQLCWHVFYTVPFFRGEHYSKTLLQYLLSFIFELALLQVVVLALHALVDLTICQQHHTDDIVIVIEQSLDTNDLMVEPASRISCSLVICNLKVLWQEHISVKA
jgi:hypothetical protein